MLNLPIVKFEKSCNYLNEQLTLQNNNKQLILDIISNIGLLLNESNEKTNQYDNILESANDFLKTISANITSIEQLNLELQNITAELTSLLSEQNKTSKSKEFYIAAFSNIKHNIIVYSKKFQELENSLTIDNNKFNEFINENNFKYNFVSINNQKNTYTFTGFSINDTAELSNNIIETIDNTTTSIVETELETNLIPNNNLVGNIISENDSTFEASITPENLISEEENIIETTTENGIVIEEISSNNSTTIDETISTNEINNEEVIENSINEETTESLPETSDKLNKIDELTNEFKSLLLNMSENNINDTTSSVFSLFKEILPESSATTFDYFINSESNEETSYGTKNKELEKLNSMFDDFDPIQLVDDYIINDLEAIIYEEHSGLIYEYDEELEEFVSYYNEEIIEELLNTSNTENTSTTSIEADDEITQSSEITTLENNETSEKEIEEVIETVEESTSEEDILLLEALLEGVSETFLVDSITTNKNNSETMEPLDFPTDEVPTQSINSEINEELFVEDLSDINEEIENVNDIEILIDNLETVENVEKSIFEELNDTDHSLLSDISFEDIMENTEIDFNDKNIFEEDLIDNIDEETLLEDSSSDIENTNLNVENNDDISLDTLDFLNDIDLLDNLDTNILDDFSSSEDELIIDDNKLEDYILEQDSLIEDEKSVLEKIYDELEKNLEDDSDNQKELENVEHFYKDPNNENEGFKNKGMSKQEFDDKLLKIENALEDNKTLVISERLHKIYLPYKVSELVNYVESYPGSYKSLKDVVDQEFILPFDYFKKHPSKSRFAEAYNLLKNREGRNFMKSVSYAFRLLNKNNLNPAIIASCKTQHELDSYLYYLDSDNLNNFKFFDIIYEVNPI